MLYFLVEKYKHRHPAEQPWELAVPFRVCPWEAALLTASSWPATVSYKCECHTTLLFRAPLPPLCLWGHRAGGQSGGLQVGCDIPLGEGEGLSSVFLYWRALHCPQLRTAFLSP